MSKSTPPSSSRGAAGVPPSGGNAKYIVIGLLLLVGMIALLAFKFGGSTDTPKPPLPVIPTVPTVPTESKIDDIPPPPPIEPTAPDTGAPKATVRGPGPDPCASKTCSGSMTPELESALSVRAKAAKRCYEQELKNEPTLKGKIAMTVRIAGNGAVCGATITNSELPAISPCVERVFRSTGSFPAPKGGCVDANVPMSFVPGR